MLRPEESEYTTPDTAVRADPPDLSDHLDRRSPLPLWAQLHSELLQRIDRGEFAAQFPGENVLAKSYGLSRHTVREALRRLRADGIVTAARGRVPRVTEPSMIDQPLGALQSLFMAVESHGSRQSSAVRKLTITHDATAAEVLELDPDEPLLYLERLRFADDRPLAIDHAWLPASLTEDLLHADFTHTALYFELERRCGISLTGGREEVRAHIPSDEHKHLLQMDDNTAVLSIRRIAMRGEQPIELRHTTVRGDQFTVSASFSSVRGYHMYGAKLFADQYE